MTTMMAGKKKAPKKPMGPDKGKPFPGAAPFKKKGK